LKLLIIKTGWRTRELRQHQQDKPSHPKISERWRLRVDDRDF
jgi:hypothetical protein